MKSLGSGIGFRHCAHIVTLYWWVIVILAICVPYFQLCHP